MTLVKVVRPVLTVALPVMLDDAITCATPATLDLMAFVAVSVAAAITSTSCCAESCRVSGAASPLT
jgi:hypothetical protein